MIFFLGLVVVGALVAAIVSLRAKHSPTPHTPATASAPPLGTTTPSARATQVRPNTTTAATTAPTAIPSPPGTTTTTRGTLTLRLQARRDTWISVRSRSSTGTLLWEGTLPAGASRHFAGPSFWVRFGAASNVSATLNRRPLTLPGGTYSVRIGPGGLGPRTA